MTARRIAIAAILLVMLGLGLLLARPLLWWYNLQRAGSQIEQGLRWPEPRLSDSLPMLVDNDALEAALGHLAAAARWQPAQMQQHRLAMQIYAARADWMRAAAAGEQALTRSPDDRVLAFEVGLMYQQIGIMRDTAPRTSVQSAFRQGVLNTPGTLIPSIYCNDTGAQSCYLGDAQYTMLDLTYPERGYESRQVIFLHPPAELAQMLTVPVTQTVLVFAVGLDPVAREWKSNGAEMAVRVQDAAGATHVRAVVPMPIEQARKGWMHGQADLTPWAGQQVLVTLVSGVGANGDATDDWYGWTNLALVSANAARAEAIAPNRRAATLWRTARLTDETFRARATEAATLEQISTWYARAEIMEDNP